MPPSWQYLLGVGKMAVLAGCGKNRAEPEDGATADAVTGLSYFLEVALAREAIDVWRRGRPGRAPSLDDQVAAVRYYAENDAWLPVD